MYSVHLEPFYIIVCVGLCKLMAKNLTQALLCHFYKMLHIDAKLHEVKKCKVLYGIFTCAKYLLLENVWI